MPNLEPHRLNHLFRSAADMAVDEDAPAADAEHLVQPVDDELRLDAGGAVALPGRAAIGALDGLLRAPLRELLVELFPCFGRHAALLGRVCAQKRQRPHEKSVEARSGGTGECCHFAGLGRNIDLRGQDAPSRFTLRGVPIREGTRGIAESTGNPMLNSWGGASMIAGPARAVDRTRCERRCRRRTPPRAPSTSQHQRRRSARSPLVSWCSAKGES